ncbi:MAG: hypothetical protein WA610_03280 [Thermodesulfovibrionales bacterium]
MIQLLIHSFMSFLDITALITLIGAALALLYLGTATARGTTLGTVLTERLHRMLLVCLGTLTITIFSGLIQRSMEMSGMGINAILPVLPTTVFKTHFGSMWLVRLTGLSVAWILWWAGRQKKGSLLFAVSLFCCGAVIAFARSASGHPADFGDLSPQQIADWLHLFSVASWAGALLTVAAILSPTAVSADSAGQQIVAGIADRLYLFFGPVLAVLVLSGLYNAWFAIGSFEALVTTSYGRLFSAKLFLILVLMVRYIAPPHHGKDTGRFAASFLSRTRVDAVVVLGVLLFVSLLIHVIPARHQAHLEHLKQLAERKSNAASQPEPVISLATSPARIAAGSPAAMTVSIKDPKGKPFRGLARSHERILHAIIISKDLGVFAHIHPEDLGPVTDEMLKKAAFPILYSFPKVGDYLIGFDFATADESYSRTVSVKVTDAPGMGAPATDLSAAKNFGDYQVSLTTSPEHVKAGTEATLRYAIRKNGRDVKNLEPYLGASMHLAIVPVDLKGFIHAHGVTKGESHSDHMHAAPPSRFGPEIETEIVFPVTGIYKVFSQVKHESKVLLFDFMITVQ